MRRFQSKLAVLHGCSAGRMKRDAGSFKFRRAVAENFRSERWHLNSKSSAVGSVRADFETAQFPHLEERDEFLTWFVPHDVNDVRWNMPNRIERVFHPRQAIGRKRDQFAIVREADSQIAALRFCLRTRITSNRSGSLLRMRTEWQ